MEQGNGVQPEDADVELGSPPASGLLPEITTDEGVEPYDDQHYLEQRPPHHE